MIHIAIEGMDGVGKTTISTLLANKLGYTFVEKPLHYLFDQNHIETYQSLSKKINQSPNRVLTSWYYGLNNILVYEQFKYSNIITDRHIVSNYAWSGTLENMDVYDLLISKIGKPKLTFILYATKDAIISRLVNRNVNDKDINRVHMSELIYEKMIYFCEVKHFNYMVIDTSNKTIDEILEIIIHKLKEYYIV